MGRTKLGIDCVGLIIVCARELGYEMDDVPEYTRRPNGYDVVRETEARLTRSSLTDIRVNDILLFRESVYPCHAGIIGRDKYNRLTVVHARASVGRVLEETFEPKWSSLASHAFRLPDRT